ncbi:MAG TPA: FAD-dependent oxidoreductase [Casimicrobiaceae bacterium]|nr:FAD-dependent oxidoreductase [Casimicrobiaceae bacterium]
MTARKTRIAILGGGCGGMTAAFWLTATQALRDRFEVTVYQRGWRLGGKGASGRNAEHSSRIEEHGLHMWLGCYENAFRTLRACFDEWTPRADSPFRKWDDAFAPQLRVTFTQQDGGRSGAAWSPWDFTMPVRDGTPGDGLPLVWNDRLLALADWLGKRLHPQLHACAEPGLVQRLLAWLVRTSIVLAVAGLWVLRALIALATLVLRAFARFRLLSRYSILADLGLTAIIGVARDILPYGRPGFDRINEYDLREWLKRHGALRVTLECAPVRAIYDLGFAYPRGDSTNFLDGRGAAGAGLRFLLEWGLSYKGAPLWKMNAGMGDVVFTPLYQVLRARGVEFRFFHEVRAIALGDDGRNVESIVVRRQAELKGASYEPLVAVGGLDCWPSHPLWDQLVDGDGLADSGIDFEFWRDDPYGNAQTLSRGADFDLAIVAFPPEMIRRVAPSLADDDARWKEMVDHSTAVATQAFQLWLRPTLPDLGWTLGSTVLSAYASPFDTWADMSHLLHREQWSYDVPATIAYFCGAFPAQDPPAARDAPGADEVERNAQGWLAGNATFLWPRKFPQGMKPAPDVVISSYFRCNVDPSERYVQTLPGSVRHRLPPAARPFDNLYLAGDWTMTRYSSGCVESAVESGMLAAQAIGGEPAKIYGYRVSG